ncbi:UDP-N-acetylmuramate--L-alanine ligase [Hornefia porci]|uniref:UDP-N-acetylmuramate--L-alanine ligase n=1 Tax=Hornefia porci TaxID=2652292 RepID=A0A1Q9JF68_9FIRM|nr:UDP-N-acetylmuramate--L-alanine ligase [Hornefia porci]OLR54751.1 UDP-N-acetylmuramate--L-alanine ligase [Hornefia porci]
MIDLKKYRNIHCIGIGGVGLSAIAEILVARGYRVSGSDMKPSEMTEKLKKSGITIYIGHRAENVENADLIIYSAAIAEENPEIIRAREKNIPLASRAEILGTLMDEYESSVAISGTHGKTTTTSMVSLVLEAAGLEPTILVGGQLDEIGGNVKVGNSPYFVTEACEYRDSFLQLRPKIEVILNIDSDHLDYFKDIDHIVRSFDKFARAVPEDGRIIAYDSNPFVSEVIKGHANVVTYGYNENSTYHISEVRFNSEGMPSFSVSHNGVKLEHVQLNVPGEHNILNAAAAFACCHVLGVNAALIAGTLESYHGTQRRFDIIGTTDRGVKVVDDYAHHPTEIRATLSAAHNIPHRKLWCLFQPHTYTRTLALFDQFADAFEQTDVLILADIYAAREKDIYNISSEKLAAEIRREHPDKEVYYMDSFEKIADYVREHAENGDVVITMGAGDIYKAGKMIMEQS